MNETIGHSEDRVLYQCCGCDALFSSDKCFTEAALCGECDSVIKRVNATDNRSNK